MGHIPNINFLLLTLAVLPVTTGVCEKLFTGAIPVLNMSESAHLIISCTSTINYYSDYI